MLSLALAIIAATPNFDAQPQLAQAAEDARWRSAVFWTGQPLPANWAKPCPVKVESRRNVSGGATQFVFDRGEVFGWSMSLVGTPNTIRDDVLPHEVDHMVRATLARRPIIRWLDEGAAGLFESSTEHARLRSRAVVFARSGAMPTFLTSNAYPRDSRRIDNLYAVGFSLTEYLLKQAEPSRLLELHASSKPFGEALFAAYGLTPRELIAAWRADIMRNPAVPCQAAGCRMHGSSSHTVRCDPASCQTPHRLVVWTAQWCTPCRQFWKDYRSDAEFRTAINARFHVHVADVDQFAAHARRHGIRSLPTFHHADGKVEGYRGKAWLLAGLGVGGSTSGPTRSSDVGDEPMIEATSQPTVDPTKPTLQARPTRTAPVEQKIDAPLATDPADNPDPGRSNRLVTLFGVTLSALEWFGLAGATTGPLGVALAALSLWRRRRRDATTPQPSAQPCSSRPEEVPCSGTPCRPGATSPDHAPFPRELDEARELLRLRQREGRVAALDAIRGMVVDDELERLAASGQTDVAAQLRRQLDERVQQIAPIASQASE